MKLLFGSIIVKGAGRINGHVVRNFRGMPLLTRLALPTKSNAFNANPQLNISTAAFKYWATLPVEDRASWSEIAGEIPFTDRWGNTKYLSGRDFVSYLFINLANIELAMIGPGAFVSISPSFTCTAVEISVKNVMFIVSDYDGEDTSYQIIYLKQGINNIRTYNSKELKLITYCRLDVLTAEQLYSLLESNGVTFVAGQTWTIGIKAISNSGLASPMQIFRAFIEE